MNVTTYGTTGPWNGRPGSGTLAEAASGLAHLTGAPDGPPTLSPVGLGDHLGAFQGIVAALTGLLARDRDGERWFDVSMTTPLLAQRLAETARTGRDPGRHGNRFPTMAPRNLCRAADGRWVAIAAGTNELVARLFAAVGSPGEGAIRWLGGELGADNDAVFIGWLGLDRAELDRLCAAGIV